MHRAASTRATLFSTDGEGSRDYPYRRFGALTDSAQSRGHRQGRGKQDCDQPATLNAQHNGDRASDQPMKPSTANAVNSAKRYRIEYLNAARAGASCVWLTPRAS